MAIVHWKDDQPHQASMSLEVDEVGVLTLTEVLLCEDEGMAASALDFDADDCPLPIARPLVTGSAGDRIEGGMWQVTRNYSGLLDEDLIGLYKLYSCSTVANREPIQTHPRFKEFAGTAGNPLNGAVFDAEGNFDRFKPYLNDGSKNRKCGVTDYLMPIVHLQETLLVLGEDLPDYIQGLGFIDLTPPNTLMRPPYPKRTWMLSKADPERVALNTYRLKREWALSGPRGWDADVYPK